MSERVTCANCGSIVVSRLAAFRADEPTCYSCLSDQTPENYDPTPGKIETQAAQIPLTEAGDGDSE